MVDVAPTADERLSQRLLESFVPALMCNVMEKAKRPLEPPSTHNFTAVALFAVRRSTTTILSLLHMQPHALLCGDFFQVKLLSNSLPRAAARKGAHGSNRKARLLEHRLLELGCWSFLGFALQAVGLQYTTASRSAFLLYLNVKLVPLLALLLYGRPSPRRTWVSALLAFTGTALLSSDGSPPNIGDLWSVMAAVASACFILRLEEASTQAESTSPEELNAATLTTSAALCSTWAAADLLLAGEGDGNADVSGIVSGGIDRAAEALSMLSDDTLPILYLGIVTTFVAQWLQALGQSRVAANDAAVIYALDPVYAAGFAYLLLDEKLGTQGLLGAGIVLVAVLLSRLPTADTDSA